MSEESEIDPLFVPRDEAELAAKAEAFAHYYLVSAQGLLESAKLEPDWLVPGAIPSNGVTFLVGRPGASKSWLAYDLVVATVQQRPWLRFDAPKSSGSPCAMVLNFDNPGSECARRFLRLGLRPNDNAHFHSLGAHRPPEGLPTILQLPTAFEPLEAMVSLLRPDVIVIDSLRQAHIGDESSSQEMAVIMSQARQLAGFGGAVIVVHHTRKNDGQMRGSTEIEAAADAIVDVDENVATWRKTRGWTMPDASVPFKLIDEGESTTLTSGVTMSDLFAREGAERGLKPSEIEAGLGLGEAAAKKAIARAHDRGLIKLVRGEKGDRIWVLATANVEREAA